MGTSTSSTQTSSPPAWAQPLFTQSATEAQNLYNSGSGGNTYTGSTVSPMSDTTMGGINQLAQAGQGWDTAGTRDLFQGIGANAVSNPYADQLGGLAGQIHPQNTASQNTHAGSVSASDFSGLLNSFGGPSSSERNLGAMANGSYLQNGNPYFNSALQGQLDQTANQVQSQFSGAGRYGSGANTGVLANSLGNIRSGALSNQFNQDTQNMLAANGQIDQSANARAGNQLAAATGVAGINTGNADRSLLSQTGNADRSLLSQTGNADRQLTGQQLQGTLLNNAGGMYSTGIGQAQTAANSMAGLDQQNFTNSLTGANATLQAGGLLDQQAQRQLGDQVSQWYSQDNQDWTRLGLLQQAAAGSAGDYGTQSGHSSSSNPLGAIGGILGALPAK